MLEDEDDAGDIKLAVLRGKESKILDHIIEILSSDVFHDEVEIGFSLKNFA